MTAIQYQVGEGFAGSGPNAAHINSILGSKDGPVGMAWANALAAPRMGYIPFVVILQPNLPVKPMTLFVNKADVRGPTHETLTWGAAQAGVASGVARAVAEGVIPSDQANSLLLIAAVWVDWAAAEAKTVFDNNAQAMHLALSNGARGLPTVEEVLTKRNQAYNPFYKPS